MAEEQPHALQLFKWATASHNTQPKAWRSPRRGFEYKKGSMSADDYNQHKKRVMAERDQRMATDPEYAQQELAAIQALVPAAVIPGLVALAKKHGVTVPNLNIPPRR